MSLENSGKRSVELTGSRRKHYLATFDGWRAIAAMMVIFWHVCNMEFQQLLVRLGGWNTGDLGVDVFFGLSGFLITYLMLVEKEASGTFNLVNFWIRRIFRIVPLTWFYVITVGVLSMVGFHLMGPNDLPPAVLFYYNYYFALGYHWSGALAHTWSLGVEMQFYLVWALMVWLANGRHVALISLGCALLVAILRWFMFHHGVAIQGYRTEFRADNLFMGAFFGALYFHAGGKSFLKQYLPPWSPPFILLTLMLVIGWQWRGMQLIEPVLIAALMTGTLVNASHDAYRWMESAPLTWLGRISFSIYIWQQLFTCNVFPRSTTFPAVLLTLPLSLMWILPVAWLSYRYIEMPGMKLGTRLIARGKQAAKPGLLLQQAVVPTEPG